MARELRDILNLPDVPRVVFEHPPLVLVVCEVQFTSILGVADPAFVFAFQRAIQADYPIVSQLQGFEFQFGLGGGPDTQPPPQRSPSRWQFTDPTRTWTVVLGTNLVSLQTRTYDDFEQFLDRFRRVMEALVQHVGPSYGTRVGLRYVNEVRPGHSDWPTAINPGLLGPVVAQELSAPEAVNQSIQQVVLRYPGGHGINLNHGVFPTGSTVPPQTPGEVVPVEPFYLLDFDVFREFLAPALLVMNADAVCQLAIDYHDVVDQLFRWSVTEEYTTGLGVRIDAGR